VGVLIPTGALTTIGVVIDVGFVFVLFLPVIIATIIALIIMTESRFEVAIKQWLGRFLDDN
jgi:hypothetical protein